MVFKMKSLSYRYVEQYDSVLKLLNSFASRFETIWTGKADPTILAKKLSKYGTTIELTEQGKQIGFAAFYHNNFETKEAFLSLIAVHPQFEHCGYGMRLLAIVETICKDSGMAFLALEVRKTNSNALGFYRKMGYKIIDDLSSSNTYYMCKNLWESV